MKLSAFALLAIISGLVHAFTYCGPNPNSAPIMEYDFTINLTLSTVVEFDGPINGEKLTYLTVAGGTFCAKWNDGVTGVVVPGEIVTYSQIQNKNATGPYRLNLEYLLKTEDDPPAYMYVKQKGWEVNYVGRTTYEFETGDHRYRDLSTGVWIGIEAGYIENATATYSSVDAYKFPG